SVLPRARKAPNNWNKAVVTVAMAPIIAATIVSETPMRTTPLGWRPRSRERRPPVPLCLVPARHCSASHFSASDTQLAVFVRPARLPHTPSAFPALDRSCGSLRLSPARRPRAAPETQVSVLSPDCHLALNYGRVAPL